MLCVAYLGRFVPVIVVILSSSFRELNKLAPVVCLVMVYGLSLLGRPVQVKTAFSSMPDCVCSQNKHTKQNEQEKQMSAHKMALTTPTFPPHLLPLVHPGTFPKGEK